MGKVCGTEVRSLRWAPGRQVGKQRTIEVHRGLPPLAAARATGPRLDEEGDKTLAAGSQGVEQSVCFGPWLGKY